MNNRFYSLLLPALLLAGCASTQHPDAPAWPQPDRSCSSATVLLDSHFEAGNLGVCEVSDDGTFTLTLYPEDAPPINPSAWFAFRISGSAGEKVSVNMKLAHGYARYWPKLSHDGQTWAPMETRQVSGGGEASKLMSLNLVLEGPHTWIAGQEIIDSNYYLDWLQELDAVEGTRTSLLAESVQGRPVYLAETADKPEFVLFIGRQHPPEVTGALGMKAFMDTIFADTDLARSFRDRFKLGAVPLLNPDGVALGHWRHNVGDTDLNRDWGPFQQPETQAVIAWVEGQEALGRELKAVIDFHSTWEDLFYTQPVVEDPLDFSSAWLNASRARLPDFPFRHVPSKDFKQPNSKNYFHNSRGIPAVTYEAGDETDREALHQAGIVFAEEFMRLMLTL